MEKMPEEQIPEGTVNIHLVRHAKSGYNQPEWNDVHTADDILDKEIEIEKIKATAKEIADNTNHDETVAIWASPTGRTLETAKILSTELTQKGVTVRGFEQNYGIDTFEQIGEVRNFNQELFIKFVNGGTINYNGEQIELKKEFTNPRNLTPGAYFQLDEIHNINREYLEKLPLSITKEIDVIEKYKDVTQRIRKILGRLFELRDKKYRIIVITHDALISDFISDYTNGEKTGINPTDMIHLQKYPEGIKVISTHTN
jgi:broad specificity phosphatase PhoE